MLEKLQFLENRNEFIKVKDIHISKKCTIDKTGTFMEQSKEKIKTIGTIDRYYKNFISLGKELYELNRDGISKLSINQGSISYLIAKLIIDNTNERSLEVIKNWLENNPVCLIDVDLNHDKIETDMLIDLSIFSYLVNSSLNNYYNKNYSNGITFSTFTNLNKDNLDEFYKLISMVMQIYEVNAKFKEQTEIIYNNNKLEIVRVYENIYSLYWFILKMQLLCMSNKYKFINLCSCGNVIIGKSKRCEICKLAWDAHRKREQRKASQN